MILSPVSAGDATTGGRPLVAVVSLATAQSQPGASMGAAAPWRSHRLREIWLCRFQLFQADESCV